MKAILGKKIGMTQIFQNEKVVPITLVQAGPCKITQVKTQEKDGYDAIQVGFEEITKKKKLTKSKKQKPFVSIREFRGGDGKSEAGNMVDVSVFQEGDIVRVAGISKGKGFQGAVKRHGFSGRNQSHGVKHEHRTLGSTGMRFPQRVIKGRRMPGRMGSERVTVKNLKIARVDKENNILAIQGAVPGRPGTLLEIRG
ncbi:MAG: 50S ribosomal protein L3 [Candidatus Wildermuthbacteria bacterium]|nr:50S ribosomal protein L3 [Candidatus Wildermuthbacteria bacterium]